MKANKSQSSGGEEFHSFEDLQEQDSDHGELSLSPDEAEQDPNEASVRTNAKDRTYWTRVFSPDDIPAQVPVPSTGKLGIFCINDDLQAHEALVKRSEHYDEDKAVPLYDPKAFNELYKPLECETYKLDKDQILEYAETATIIRE